MPDLTGYGEDRLVAALLARLPRNVCEGNEIVAGAGDDCAVISLGNQTGKLQLLKTDCVIEGVHYTADTPPEKVGWKALCRPLSDIAAMGGQPLHALVTLALPETAAVSYATAIYDGLGLAAQKFGVHIVGGETARSPSAGFLSVVLTGEVQREKLVTRAGGKPTDCLYVTGTLGGSFVTGKHLDFTPRITEARWLVSHFSISAMMDLSDGLNRDLPRMATASGTGYSVDSSLLPCTQGHSAREAASDGEDYELLFAIAAAEGVKLEFAWRAAWPEVPLTHIGRLTAKGQCSGIDTSDGHDHFGPRK